MKEQHQKSFLGELQSLDEPAKKKVIIAGTIVIMVIVIYIWFGFFNGWVTSTSSSGSAASVSSTATIGQEFDGIGNWFAGIFEGPRQYNIQPK